MRSLCTGTITNATFTACVADCPVVTPTDDSAVPEPGSLILLGSGLVMAANRFRRRRG